MNKDKQVKDSIVEAVKKDLTKRSKKGIKKYNTTLDRTDLSFKDWLQHAYEEGLDQVNYLKKAIIEYEKTNIVNNFKKDKKKEKTKKNKYFPWWR